MKYIIVSAILLMSATVANAEDVLYVDTAIGNDNQVHMTVFKSVDKDVKGATSFGNGYYGIKEVLIPMNRQDVLKMRDAFDHAAKMLERHAK